MELLEYPAFKTGKGVIQIRGNVDVESHKDRERIVINDLPYQVNKARLIEKIASLVNQNLSQVLVIFVMNLQKKVFVLRLI